MNSRRPASLAITCSLGLYQMDSLRFCGSSSVTKIAPAGKHIRGLPGKHLPHFAAPATDQKASRMKVSPPVRQPPGMLGSHVLMLTPGVPVRAEGLIE